MALNDTITALGNAIINLVDKKTPIATANTVGMVKPDGSTINIDANGVISSNGGSGLEVCDIGMALYVDETKGLRRYLNGQIVDRNTNTEAFFTRLQEITTLHPSLLCTEEEWQTAKTMSAFGQVGKFVFNYETVHTNISTYADPSVDLGYGDEGGTGGEGGTGNTGGDNTENTGEQVIVSVRLPRVVNIQGLFDLQNLGMTVGAGLPNITGGINTYENRFDGASGSFSISGWSGNANYHANGGGGSVTWIDFNASRSNSIYGNSDTVQQEAIQYPYFIQIATGSETENNIINEIELNNPYSLFDSKYSDHELNNLSWLASNGQWNAKAVYPTAYDKLLKIYNGTETVEGLSVKLHTDTSATDYDFRINTADETFRLPLRNGTEGMFGNVPVVGNGTNICFVADEIGYQSKDFGMYVGNGSIYGAEYIQGTGIGQGATLSNWRTVSLTTDPTKSGIVTDPSSAVVPDGWNLYFYVGETVQNANLIDAGRIGEQLANALAKPHIIDTYVNGASWYRVYSDGWCEQGGYNSGGDQTISLLKGYKDTNYYINTSHKATDGGYPAAYETYFSRVTTTSFYIACQGTGGGSGSALGYAWKTAGYIS